jgi:uracil phosphoribosyltransferase
VVKAAGAKDLALVCIVAAPEGVVFVTQRHPEVPIFIAALDRELNAMKYILPGLGDFGDRLYGT